MENPLMSSERLDHLVPNVERFLDTIPHRLATAGKIAARLALTVGMFLGADTLVGNLTANRPAEVIELSTDEYKNDHSYDPNLLTLAFPTFGNRENGCKAAEHSQAQAMGRVACIKLSDSDVDIADIAHGIGEKFGLDAPDAKPLKVIVLAESTGGMISYQVMGEVLRMYPGTITLKGFILDGCETGADDVADSKKQSVMSMQSMAGGRATVFAQQSLVSMVSYKSNPFDITTWSNIARVTSQLSMPAMRAQASFINWTKLVKDPLLANVPVAYIRDKEPANDSWVNTSKARVNWGTLFNGEITDIALPNIGHAGLVNGSYDSKIQSLIARYNTKTNFPAGNCRIGTARC